MKSCREAATAKAHAPQTPANCEILPLHDVKASSGDKNSLPTSKRSTCMDVAHLLELLDGTLVDAAALVDQICDTVSKTAMARSQEGGSAYVRWWSTCRSRRGR